MLTIRDIEPTDRAAWGALWTKYLAFYETVLPENVFETTFARLMTDAPHEFNGFVAEEGGKLIGLTHYLFHRHAWKEEDVCYLQDLFVDNTCRGSGAAQALIEAVYDAADRQGAPSVYWMTQSFNTVGRRLYDRIGRRTPFIRYNR